MEYLGKVKSAGQTWSIHYSNRFKFFEFKSSRCYCPDGRSVASIEDVPEEWRDIWKPRTVEVRGVSNIKEAFVHLQWPNVLKYF